MRNKDVVNSIYIDKVVSFSLNNDLCDQEKQKMLQTHTTNFPSGDLRLSENKKLRKL